MSKRLGVKERGALSRSWWFERGRNALWVLLVSVLVWIYADLQHTDSHEFTSSIVLHSTDPDRIITSPARQKVAFKIVGSRRNVEIYRERFNADDLTRFDVAKLPAGASSIPALPIVQQVPQFNELGLSVQGVSPDTIAVTIEMLASHEVPVEFVPVGRELDGKAQVTPDRIAVRCTESAWQRILSKTNSKPTLKTLPQDLRAYTPGQTLTLGEVKLESQIADEPVALVESGATVNVSATIGQYTDAKELSISVALLCPVTWAEDGTWAKFSLVRKDDMEWRPKIKVTGPKTDIAKVSDSMIEAYVVLEDRHKKDIKSWETEEVRIRFLGDLQLNVVGPAPKVQFKMQQKSEEPAEP
ncbi:MAG: hypothetical protein ABFD92_20790 [Planctomycetaceae bacterium]|nr:hypothetical protein [Planctomycetaceae bacterium]